MKTPRPYRCCWKWRMPSAMRLPLAATLVSMWLSGSGIPVLLAQEIMPLPPTRPEIPAAEAELDLAQPPANEAAERQPANSAQPAPLTQPEAFDVLPGQVDAEAGPPATQPQVERPQVTAPQSLEEKLNRRGTIVMRDANLGDWLFAIQQEWKINIVFSNDIRNEIVNGAFEDLTLREVLNAILLTRGYGYQPVGNSLLIVPGDKMGQLKPQFTDAIIPLERLRAADVEPSVRILLSPDGQVQAIPSSRSLYVVDLPERIGKVRQHLEVLEENARVTEERERQQAAATADGDTRDVQIPDEALGPGIELETEVVEVFSVRFVNLEGLESAVQAVIGPEGRISALTDDSKLVVIAPAGAVRAAARVIQRLDVPRPQVRITALLYDVRLEDMERLGVNWSHSGQGRFNADGDPLSLFEMNSTNFPLGAPAAASDGDGGDGDGGGLTAAASNPLGGLVTLRHLSRHFDLNAFIQALSTLEGARLLARPNVIAYDGIPAEFRSVSEIPVQQLTQTAEGGNIGTTEFREAGITLIVTPRINNDGSLRLEIAPEFSVLAGFQDGQPIIDRRSANTMVHMLDGEMVVIGGLLRRNELETQRGVPGLKHMKYLGPLFRDHETTVTESELLVIVKAEIVGPKHPLAARDEMAAVTLNHGVDSIPMASFGPILPHCRDPYCPLHNPPPHVMGHHPEAHHTHTPEMMYESVVEPPASTEPPLDGQMHPPAAEPAADAAMRDSRVRSRPIGVSVPTPRAHRPLVPGIRTDGEPLFQDGAPENVTMHGSVRGSLSQYDYHVIRRLPHVSNETPRRALMPASAQGIARPLPSIAPPPQTADGQPPRELSSRRTPTAPSTPPKRRTTHWLNKFIR